LRRSPVSSVAGGLPWSPQTVFVVSSKSFIILHVLVKCAASFEHLSLSNLAPSSAPQSRVDDVWHTVGKS
jgi:hypothetical protein